MMACPEARMAVEKGFLDALSGKHGAAISGARLTLTPASGSPLVFQAEPEPRLEGFTWKVTAFNNGRHAVVGLVTNTTLTLSFENGMVRGSSGCNTFRAPYTSDGNRLSIGAAVTTRKACTAEGVMEQERLFLAALKTAQTWTVEGGTLDVHRTDGQRVLMATGTAGSSP
jgi:heat shock protein HslJ